MSRRFLVPIGLLLAGIFMLAIVKNSHAGTLVVPATTTTPNASPPQTFASTTLYAMLNYVDRQQPAPPLVEVHAQVLKKISVTSGKPPTQHLFVEVADGAAIGLVDLDAFTQLYSQVLIGNSVLVRGAFGSFTCDAATMSDPGVAQLCNSLKTMQVTLPIIVALPPDPKLGNVQPLLIVK